MGLHEELQNLDPNRLSEAFNSVMGRLAADSPVMAQETASTQAQDYAVLAGMPRMILDFLKKQDPSMRGDAMIIFNYGATALSAVLAEYAQLEKLERDFPDMPSIDQ